LDMLRTTEVGGMLRSFVTWPEGGGPSGVIRALVGQLSITLLLGALLGGVAVTVGVLVAALLGLLGAVLLLMADRRTMRRELTRCDVRQDEAGAQAG
jgi:hypothetical protein